MRIVHLTQSTTAEITGGLEYHIAYLTATLRRLGHEVIVVNTAEVTRSVSTGVDLHSVFPRRRIFALLPKRLRCWLDTLVETLTLFGRRLFRRRHGPLVAAHVASLQPDLVHQHSYIGELHTCRLLRRKYPLVFTNHTGAYLHFDHWWPTRPLQRLVMRKFTAVIAPSRELLPDTANSCYISNGVDTATFYPFSTWDRDRVKTKYQCIGKHIFLCPRRWAPTKGIIYLARALRHLPEAITHQCIFLFAGNETPGYSRYQQHVHRELSEVDGDIRIMGNLGHIELAELMNISDTCLFPSLMEATSLACLESMACGTPVIGTRCGGLIELIREDENGWLVPMRDEQALVGAIEHALTVSPAKRSQMGHDATKLVHQNYTWEAVARQTESVYRAALTRWI